MSKERKIAYEPHPVTAERKKELNDQGYKIIDARFAPADHQSTPEQKDGEPKERVSKGMDVEQIKAKLTEKGITFDKSANKPELARLLDESAE